MSEPMTPPPAWAALFDWDGVIVDSSRHHEESWNRLAQSEGLRLADGHFQQGFGMKNDVIIPEILRWTTDPDEVRRLSERKERLYRQVVRETGVEPLPGVVKWLRALKRAGVPCVIGSSTHRLNITASLELLGLDAYFREIVSAEDVARGKPDPEVFLTAARRAGMAPSRCVVFEDAPVGIAAARAAGMKVVAVTSTRSARELQGADRVVNQLDELSVSDVGAWFPT
jgi:beta-phosphoglucomutase family hydrolase